MLSDGSSAHIIRLPVGVDTGQVPSNHVVYVWVRAASGVQKTRACCAKGARRRTYLFAVLEATPFIFAHSAAPTCKTRVERIAGGHICWQNPRNPARKINYGYLDTIPEQRLSRPMHWKAAVAALSAGGARPSA